MLPPHNGHQPRIVHRQRFHGKDWEDWHMAPYMIIVARDRPNWFELLRSRHGHEPLVILDRRQTPRLTPRAAGLCHTNLERDGYIVMPTTRTGVLGREAATRA